MQGIYSFAWNDSNSGPSKSNTLSQNMVASRPKKRKGSTFSQPPWHKAYLQGTELSHSFSSFRLMTDLNTIFLDEEIYEQEWGLVTNTLCEKVDPSETISPSKSRLVLSTHLMQHLLRPAPAFVFSGNNAALNYELVLYFLSRISLGHSCSFKQRLDLDKSQTLKIASDQDQQYSSLVKALMDKMQKLESDFQILERTTSILDIILEIQDLERFSVINHLGKFHNRGKTSTRPVPQRCIVGIQMPVDVPEPLHCLPL